MGPAEEGSADVAAHTSRILKSKPSTSSASRARDEVVAGDQHGLHRVLQRALSKRLAEELLRRPENTTENPRPPRDPAAVVGEEPQRLLGGAQRPAVLAAREEQCGEDAANAGASSGVEEVGDTSVRFAGLAAEASLEVREGLRGEDAVGGAGAVNAEDADLAGGVFRRFRVSRRKINRIGAIFGVAVAEKEIVLQNGKDFVGELVDFEVRVNHVKVH